MLLIDGVKYELWTPPTEDEFEQVVKKHAQEIFGEQSIYFDRKQKLKSLSGIGSIPDGYTIVLGDSPQWHVVEMELSAHLPHDHVVTQLNKFTLGIRNPSTQNNLVKAIYEYITGDDFLTLRLKKETTCTDIHNFLADLISKQPVITVIIEKKTEELGEALSMFRREYKIEIVEFQTFVREGTETVHAHLFEPLYTSAPSQVKLETTGLPMHEIELSLANCINYHFFPIYDDDRSFFPEVKIPFIFETDFGEIKTNLAGTANTGIYIQRNLKKWFEAHPELKKGDKVAISVIEPMKKYRLEIVK